MRFAWRLVLPFAVFSAGPSHALEGRFCRAQAGAFDPTAPSTALVDRRTLGERLDDHLRSRGLLPRMGVPGSGDLTVAPERPDHSQRRYAGEAAGLGSGTVPFPIYLGDGPTLIADRNTDWRVFSIAPGPHVFAHDLSARTFAEIVGESYGQALRSVFRSPELFDIVAFAEVLPGIEARDLDIPGQGKGKVWIDKHTGEVALAMVRDAVDKNVLHLQFPKPTEILAMGADGRPSKSDAFSLTVRKTKDGSQVLRVGPLQKEFATAARPTIEAEHNRRNDTSALILPLQEQAAALRAREAELYEEDTNIREQRNWRLLLPIERVSHYDYEIDRLRGKIETAFYALSGAALSVPTGIGLMKFADVGNAHPVLTPLTTVLGGMLGVTWSMISDSMRFYRPSHWIAARLFPLTHGRAIAAEASESRKKAIRANSAAIDAVRTKIDGVEAQIAVLRKAEDRKLRERQVDFDLGSGTATPQRGFRPKELPYTEFWQNKVGSWTPPEIALYGESFRRGQTLVLKFEERKALVRLIDGFGNTRPPPSLEEQRAAIDRYLTPFERNQIPPAWTLQDLRAFML